MFAQQNNIKDAPMMIDEISEAVSHWPQTARECDVPAKTVDAIFQKFNLLVA